MWFIHMYTRTYIYIHNHTCTLYYTYISKHIIGIYIYVNGTVLKDGEHQSVLFSIFHVFVRKNRGWYHDVDRCSAWEAESSGPSTGWRCLKPRLKSFFSCAGELTHLKSLGVDVSHSSSNAHHDFPFCSVLSRQRPATSEFATGAWFVACDAALMPCWNWKPCLVPCYLQAIEGLWTSHSSIAARPCQ